MSNYADCLDPYSWLEDSHRERTRQWCRRQTRILQRRLQTDEMRGRISRLVRAFIGPAVFEAPTEARGYWFYRYRSHGEPQPDIYIHEPGATEPRRLLPAGYLRQEDFISRSILMVAPDASRVAVGIRTGGRDEYDLVIVSIRDGQVFSVHLPDWKTHRTRVANDLKAFYYVDLISSQPWLFWQPISHPRQPSALPLCRLELKDISSLSLDSVGEGRYLLISVYSRRGALQDAFILDTHVQACELVPVLRDFRSVASIREYRDYLFMRTDRGAPHGQVLGKPVMAGEDGWEVIVPESNRVLQQLAIVGGKLFLRSVHNLKSELTIHNLDGRPYAQPDLPGNGTIGPIQGTLNGNYACYEFSALDYPPTIFAFHVPSRCQVPWCQKPVAYDPAKVVRKVRTCHATDGTPIAVELTHLESTSLGPDTPVLLTAYGGYGVCDTPRYSTRAALWIALGGAYAQAFVRGGGEFGSDWHEAGRRHKKTNTFSDFIAAAEWMIANGIAVPQKLAIAGGSNSGLVVGVALTQRPSLFAAVISFGPFLDMLRFHLFAGARIGVDEYGDPDDPEDRRVLNEYSPYHHVKEGIAYPAVLLISGSADTRVDPMHARKMTAKLQASTASDKPILLDYHEQRGHAALLPTAERVETLTNQFCFLMQTLSLTLGDSDIFRTRTDLQNASPLSNA